MGVHSNNSATQVRDHTLMQTQVLIRRRHSVGILRRRGKLNSSRPSIRGRTNPSMQRSGYEVSRKAVATQLCSDVRAESLRRACHAPRWRPRLASWWRQGLTSVAHRFQKSAAASPGTVAHPTARLGIEDSIYTSHSRTLLPLVPCPNVTLALRNSLAALGGPSAMARIGLSASATLFELNVLISLPGAAAQPPHVDQLPRPGLSMGTLFLALQDTTADMGATVLFPAPPCAVAARCDWDAIRRQAGSAAAFGESFGPSGESDSAEAALVRHMHAEAAAEGQSLEPAAPSPWWQHSAAELGLGAPVAMELGAGDVMLVDYRTFHCGGANVSSKLRAQLYATFVEDRDPARASHTSHSLGPEMLERRYRLRDFL